MHSHFHVQPNYCVEAVLWLCCIVIGVVTIIDYDEANPNYFEVTIELYTFLAELCCASICPKVTRNFSAIMIFFLPSLVPYGPVWLCMVPFGPAWFHMVPIVCMVPYAPMRSCTVPYGPIQSFMVL